MILSRVTKLCIEPDAHHCMRWTYFPGTGTRKSTRSSWQVRWIASIQVHQHFVRCAPYALCSQSRRTRWLSSSPWSWLMGRNNVSLLWMGSWISKRRWKDAHFKANQNPNLSLISAPDAITFGSHFLSRLLIGSSCLSSLGISMISTIATWSRSSTQVLLTWNSTGMTLMSWNCKKSDVKLHQGKKFTPLDEPMSVICERLQKRGILKTKASVYSALGRLQERLLHSLSQVRAYNWSVLWSEVHYRESDRSRNTSRSSRSSEKKKRISISCVHPIVQARLTLTFA